MYSRIVILLLAASISLPCQSPRRGREQNFHGVILDGTETVLPNPNPHSRVYDFLKTFQVAPRTRFETTEAYTARAYAVDDTFSYLFALPWRNASATGCQHRLLYDADAESLTVAIDVEDGIVRVSCEEKTAGTYTGVNGFGVKKTIVRILQYDVGFQNSDIPSYKSELRYSIHLSLDSAKVVVPRLALAVLAGAAQRENGSWFESHSLDNGPTISNPRETTGSRVGLNTSALTFYLYDRATRAIFLYFDAAKLKDGS